MFEELIDVDETEEKRLLAKDIIEFTMPPNLSILSIPRCFVTDYREKFLV